MSTQQDQHIVEQVNQGYITDAERIARLEDAVAFLIQNVCAAKIEPGSEHAAMLKETAIASLEARGDEGPHGDGKIQAELFGFMLAMSDIPDAEKSRVAHMLHRVYLRNADGTGLARTVKSDGGVDLLHVIAAAAYDN